MMREKMKRVRIGPIGTAILVTVGVTGAVTFLALLPGLSVLLAPFIRKKKYSPKQAIQNNIESLVRTGLLVKKIDKNGDVTLELTKKGKWESLLRSNSFDSKKERWDKIWRVVIFDVPEHKVKIRNELRRAMVMYGFKQLQKSVWVYPFGCDDFVMLIKRHLGISSDVLYMKVMYIENDKYLRKEFNIT